MSRSLKDQLLALGLDKGSSGKAKDTANIAPAVEPQPKRARRAHPEKKQRAASGTEVAEADFSLEEAYRLREQQSREQAAKARERKQAEDRRRRDLNNAIRAIVEPNRLNDPAADFSRNFLHKGRIRKVNVTAAQLSALNEGMVGLVYLAGGYHILPPECVEQVRALSEEHVPDLAGNEDEDEQFPVPDDLIW